MTLRHRIGRVLQLLDVAPHRVRQQKGIEGGPGDDQHRTEDPAAWGEPHPQKRNQCQRDGYSDEKREEETTGHSPPPGLGRYSLGNFEAVSGATHGLKIARRLSVCLDLFADAAYVDVDGTGSNEAGVTPDGVEEMVAAEDPSRVPGEVVEQAELGGRGGDEFPVDPKLHGAGIDFDILELEDGRRAGPFEAAQHSFYPRYQFAGPEGLGDVVIGAHIEAVDAVIFRGAGGQKDNGHDAESGVLAKPPAEVQAVAAGDHDVEQK